MKKITRWDMLCVGLLLGGIVACLCSGCGTIRGMGHDLAGLAEGMGGNWDAPTRMKASKE